jgi:hypothetical protein
MNAGIINTIRKVTIYGLIKELTWSGFAISISGAILLIAAAPKVCLKKTNIL